MTAKDVQRRLAVMGRRQWELAQQIGVTEGTLCVWLRQPLDGERLSRVEAGLQQLEEVAENG